MTQRTISAHRIGFFPIAIFLAICGFLAMLFIFKMAPDALDDIQQNKELRVVTRTGPTTFYLEDNALYGFEYELAQAFANYLGVKLTILREDSLEGIINKTALGGAHLAAAGLAITAKREASLTFTDSYYEVDALIVYRSGEEKPRDIEDLVGKNIAIIKDSAYEETLEQYQQDYPQLTWTSIAKLESIDFLEMVRDFHFDYAVIDSNEFDVNRQLFPDLDTGFVLGQTQTLAWAMMPGRVSESLREKANSFFEEIHANGLLSQLIDKYFGNHSDISRGSAAAFASKVDTVLPKYIDLIKKVALEENIDWHLLAAIAYQESHWNPLAVSPTGVRGMMMLTLVTAKELGVNSRLDAEQSLRGGAQYFNKLYQRLPQRIQEPDRTSFSLAAYNVGLGHLEDARIITQKQNKNPDSWEDVKDHLPLLQKRRWYSNTKYGYARGQEPVNYVYNIRHYESYLRWQEINATNKTIDNENNAKSDDEALPETLQKGLNTL